MVRKSFLTREQELKIGQSTSKGEVVLGQVVKTREQIRAEVQGRKIKTGKKKKKISAPIEIPIASKTILESQLKALPSTSAESSATAKLTSPKQEQQKQKERSKLQRGQITQRIIPTGSPVSFQEDITKVGTGSPGKRVTQVTPSESVVIKEKIPEVPEREGVVKKLRSISQNLGEQFKEELITGVPVDPRTAKPIDAILIPTRTFTKGVLSVGTGALSTVLDVGVSGAKLTSFVSGFDPRRAIQRDIAISRGIQGLGGIGKRIKPRLKQSKTLFGALSGIGQEFAPEVATGTLIATAVASNIKAETIRSPTTVLGDILAFQGILKVGGKVTKAISTELKVERATAFAIKAGKTPKGQTFKFPKSQTGELVVSRTGQITGLRQLGLDPSKPVRLLESQQFLQPSLGTTFSPAPIAQRKLPAVLFQKGLGVGKFRGSPLGKTGTQLAKTRTQLPDILGQGLVRTESGSTISQGFGQFKISKITGKVEFVRSVPKPSTQLTIGETLQLKTPTELVGIKITKPGERVLKLFDFPSKKGQSKLFSDLETGFGVFGEGSRFRTQIPKFKFSSDLAIKTLPSTPQNLLVPSVSISSGLLRQAQQTKPAVKTALLQRTDTLLTIQPSLSDTVQQAEQVQKLRLSGKRVLKKRKVSKARARAVTPPALITLTKPVLIQQPIIQQEQLIQQPPVQLLKFKTPFQREKPRPIINLGFDFKTKPKLDFVKAFDVEVKEKGQFRLLGTGFTELGALSRGAQRVEETASATFRIIQKGFTTRKDDFTPFSNFGQRFRKKDERTFIERRKFRISTPGELKGITFAPRKKKKGKNQFDIFSNLKFS